MFGCDVCQETDRHFHFVVLDEDRELMLCTECDNGDLTHDELYDIVQARRWAASKSEKRWNADDPITPEDTADQ